jgi:hypothetical protein
MLGSMFLPFHTKLSKVWLFSFYSPSATTNFSLRILVVVVITSYIMGQGKYFVSCLLTNYSTGIQRGAKPTINFKVIILMIFYFFLLIASSIEITV